MPALRPPAPSQPLKGTVELNGMSHEENPVALDKDVESGELIHVINTDNEFKETSLGGDESEDEDVTNPIKRPAEKPWMAIQHPGDRMPTIGRMRIEWSVRMGIIYLITIAYALSKDVTNSKILSVVPLNANFYATFAIGGQG